MKKYYVPTMRLHQLKTGATMLSASQEKTFSTPEPTTEQDEPATQGFTSREAW